MFPPLDPYLLELGPVGVRWYSALMVLAILAAIAVAAYVARRCHLERERIWPLAWWVIPAGIVGARIYYVAFEWGRFADDPLRLLQFWNMRGLAIHGAIIGGALGMLLYAWRHRIDFRPWCDAVAVGLPLAQAIGRWGNYFNQEAFGPPTDFPLSVQIDAAHRYLLRPEWQDVLTYPTFHATFFYESMWNLAVFGILMLALHRLGRKLRPGDLTLLYLTLYSVGRLVIEGLRIDSLMLGPLRVAQVVSVVVIVAGLSLLLGRRWLAARRLNARRRAEAAGRHPG